MTRLTVLGFLTFLAASGVYFLACWWFPFAACFRCDGDGKFRSRSGKAWRYCRRCKGSGNRLRIGRRVWQGMCSAGQDAR